MPTVTEARQPCTDIDTDAGLFRDYDFLRVSFGVTIGFPR